MSYITIQQEIDWRLLVKHIVNKLSKNSHLELHHIVLLDNELTGSNHVDSRALSTTPRHHRPACRSTDIVLQCPTRVELPQRLIQLFECLRQTARCYFHAADVHVVQGPPKTYVSAGGRVTQLLPPA